MNILIKKIYRKVLPSAKDTPPAHEAPTPLSTMIVSNPRYMTLGVKVALLQAQVLNNLPKVNIFMTTIHNALQAAMVLASRRRAIANSLAILSPVESL